MHRESVAVAALDRTDGRSDRSTWRTLSAEGRLGTIHLADLVRRRALRRPKAEREGFEPPLPLRVKRFSRPPRSTALPPLQCSPASIARRKVVNEVAAKVSKRSFTDQRRCSARAHSPHSRPMRITFLGTGTSQGVPVIGCSCAVCLSDDPRDKRLRVSALVEVNGTRILIDAGPDLRQQMLRANVKDLDASQFTEPVRPKRSSKRKFKITLRRNLKTQTNYRRAA